MVNDTNKKDQEEEGAIKIILDALKEDTRGISITGFVKNHGVSKGRVRIALAYLLGAGKIEEVRASMAKLYYLI